jgi:hypothetical protein
MHIHPERILMTSFWQSDRNRGELDERTPPKVRRLLENIADARRALITHPVYTQVDNLASLHTFMSFHVWAVWDFMCLLKSLQTQLSCVQVPWFPQGDRALRRLVNEIVVSEESDEDGHGGFAAHFELYLEAMQQCGADARAIQRFITALREGKETTAALALAAPPAGAQAFSLHTSQTVTTGSLPTLAAAFTFGREDVVPSMFQAVLDEIQESHLSTYDRFIYYLDRHIAVDADEHGPMAFEMVDRICGDDERKWKEAETAARRHIESRIRLWDGALDSITRSRRKHVFPRWMTAPTDTINAERGTSDTIATA